MVDEIDHGIIRLAAQGDQRAFKTIYDQYAPFVWKVVFRTTNGDIEAAKEIMQNTFVRAHSAMRKFSFDSAFSTWLYRIAYNAALTFVAKRRLENGRTTQYHDTLPGNRQANAYDNREAVTRILSSLAADERFLLTAREASGLAFEELSAITGKSEGALRTALHRIKERIRKEYGHEYHA